VYDDFKGSRPLDPDKWTGLNFQNSDGATLELGRDVKGGRLRFLQRVVGGTASNVAEHFAVNALTSTTGASAIALEARFDEFDLTHCSEPGAVDGFVLLRLFNNLFSDTDGNVFAFIDISQSSGSGEDRRLNVTAEMSHEAFGSLAVLDLGTVRVGKRFTVRMEWVPGGDRVDFQLFEDFDGLFELALTAVNHKQVRHSSLSLQNALIASLKYLCHRRVVISPGFMADIESPVFGIKRALLIKHHA